MHQPPTLSVYAIVPDGALSELTTVGGETVTIHPTGVLSQPALMFSSLDELDRWSRAVRRSVAEERIHRDDAARALAEMDATLRKAGAR
jgi:hypothetical protein